MNGGSEKTAGNQDLTIGQLEGHLELAMAMSKHLAAQRGVNQHTARVAMESFGLELPAATPLSSFTVHFSKTNYDIMVERVQLAEVDFQNKLIARTRKELSDALESIVVRISKDRPPYEPQHQLLKLVSNYVKDFYLDHLADDHREDLAQAEWTKIQEIMTEWRTESSLGQEVIDCGRLYNRAHGLWELVQGALGKKLRLSSLLQAEHLLSSIGGFTAAARCSVAVEPENAWGPDGLINHTLKFMETFDGPIPYKLQESVGSIEELLRDVESMTDVSELQSLLIVAHAVDSYLAWCWRLDEARAVAVDCSIRICRTAGHLRALTA